MVMRGPWDQRERGALWSRTRAVSGGHRGRAARHVSLTVGGGGHDVTAHCASLSTSPSKKKKRWGGGRGALIQCCFTSTETVRFIRDGELRTATSTFTQLMSYDEVLVVTYEYVGPGGRMVGVGGGGGGGGTRTRCVRELCTLHTSVVMVVLQQAAWLAPLPLEVVTPSRSDGELGTVEDCTCC